MGDDPAFVLRVELRNADALFSVIRCAAEMFGFKYDLHGDSSFARIVTLRNVPVQYAAADYKLCTAGNRRAFLEYRMQVNFVS